MPEQHEVTWRGHRILMVNDHRSADAALAAAGWQVPAIPAGCNTALFAFTTAGGARALAINQSGFHRELRDDEQEVNGCTLLVLGESLGSPALDDAVLEGFRQELNAL